MFQIGTEQKVCEVGGVKFGGQPGEYPCVCVSSIFQKGDKVFTGKRKEGFDEKRAEELLKTQERLTAETGVPGMADIVANTGDEFKAFIDFVSEVSSMPFCIDAWVMKPKLAGAAYCAEKGLLDRMFYNSLTVWEKGKAVYRPTMHYAYCPCDCAIVSLNELRCYRYELQPKIRIMNDEITSGADILGALLMGHAYNAWWVGSDLSIETSRRLVPHQNATTMQVAISVVAAA